jgi:hypothetical protein
MPESSRMVPLYVVRVADLRVGRMVGVVCQKCGHVAEVRALTLRERLPRDEFVKHIGIRFHCQRCGHKSAEIDVRGALGYFG